MVNCAPFLVLLNVISLLLSIAMIGLGGYAETKHLGLDILSQGIIAVGVIIFFLSLLAIYGSRSGSKNALTLYMTLTFLITLALVFLAVGALVFKEYVFRLVADGFDANKATLLPLAGCSTTAARADQIACLQAFAMQHAKIIGGVALAAAVALLGGLIASVQILGFSSVLRLIVRLLAISFIVIGVAISAFGFRIYQTSGAINPAVVGCGVVGLLVIFTALLGVYGSRDGATSTAPLTLYALFLAALTFVVFIMGWVLYSYDWKTYLATGDNFTKARSASPKWIQDYLANKCTSAGAAGTAAELACERGVIADLFAEYSKIVGLFGVIVFFWLVMGVIATVILRSRIVNGDVYSAGTPGLPLPLVSSRN